MQDTAVSSPNMFWDTELPRQRQVDVVCPNRTGNVGSVRIMARVCADRLFDGLLNEYIALNYQDKMTLTNNEIIHGISVQLAKLESQQQRLIHYIGLMDEKDAEVIRMTYMDGMDTDQIAAQTGVSVRTVRTRRANAINHLCAMFEYTATLHPDKVME